MKDLDIRRPVEDDIDALMYFLARIHRDSETFGRFPFKADTTREAMLRVISDNHPDVHFRVVLHRGAVVGAILAEIGEDLWTSARYASQHGIFVLKEYYGTGAGKMLMDDTYAWMRERGANVLRMTVSGGVDDDRAAAFMEKQGMQRRGTLYGMEID